MDVDWRGEGKIRDGEKGEERTVREKKGDKVKVESRQ